MTDSLAAAARPRRLVHALVALGGMLSVIPFSAPTAAAPTLTSALPWFAGQIGGATQVVAVTGDQSGQATIEVWGDYDGHWWSMTGPLSGHIGSAGPTDQAREDVPATPTGVFSLPWAFGTETPPKTALPFHRTGANDWWVADASSPLYNTFQTCAPGTCRFNEQKSEQLDIPAYALAIVIGVNPNREPGAGSAYFVHLDGGGPTAGCVTIGEPDLRSLIMWLKPGAVIDIRGN